MSTPEPLEVVCTLCAETRPRAECISGNDHFACTECIGLAVGFFVETRGPSFLAAHFFDAAKQLAETRALERARAALRLAITSTEASAPDVGFITKAAAFAKELGDPDTCALAIARIPVAARSHALRVLHANALLELGRREEAATELAAERMIGASSGDELAARLMRCRLELTPGCSPERAGAIVQALEQLGGILGTLPDLELERRVLLTDALLAAGHRGEALRAANAALVLAPDDPRAAQAWTRARS